MTKRRETPPAPAIADPEGVIDTRELPKNLDAERALLGAILINSKQLLVVQQSLAVDHFFRRAHQAIYDAMIKLEARRVEIDLVTLSAELERAGTMAEVGGPAYVSALTDGVPRSANVKHYAGIVRQLWTRRQIIEQGKRLVDQGYDIGTNLDELMLDADRTIVELQRSASEGSRTREIDRESVSIYQSIEERVENKGRLLGITSGFASIDDITQGWQTGDMVVIAARPSIGKTAFTLNAAVHAAAAGARVMIFSLEMRFEQLKWRLLSHLSGVPLTRLLSGFLGESDYANLAAAMGRFSELKIAVNDAAHRTVWDIRAECRRRKSDAGIDLVIVDYFQLLTGTLEGRRSRYEQLTDASRQIKVLADEIQAPILLLSQLNRGGATRSDSRPRLEDLRETGALEQDADTVAFLHRKHHLEDGITQFILEKQRNGPGGEVNLNINRRTQTFTDAGTTPVQETLPEEPPEVQKPPPGFSGRRGRKSWRRR